MAYLHALRESAGCAARAVGHAVHRGSRRALACVPTPCSLCQGSARGGLLCGVCRDAVVASMIGPAPRCGLCALALDAGQSCPDCALRPPAFERVIAAFDYAAPGDLLIHHLKAGRRFITAAMLADLLARSVRRAAPPLPGNTILVPVPASRASVLERGFNPAAEVARCLGRALQMPCRPTLLRRAREGQRQTRLGRAERFRSVQDLYCCPQRVEGAAIAVVDDVLTTGSTLHSIALQFRKAGASTVYGLVLARTPYR
jgi:ComF family protein